MKTFIKKTFIVLLAAIIFALISTPLLHVGDQNITQVDYQILYDLDYPQSQLNDLSLREVFEDLYYSDLYTTYTGVVSSNGTYSIKIYNTTTFNNGDIIYHIFDREFSASLTSQTEIRHYIYGSPVTSVVDILKDGSRHVFSQLRVVVDDTLSTLNTFRVLNGVTEQTITVNHYYSALINLTALGIDTLSVDQIDFWYNIYNVLKGLEV